MPSLVFLSYLLAWNVGEAVCGVRGCQTEEQTPGTGLRHLWRKVLENDARIVVEEWSAGPFCYNYEHLSSATFPDEP